MKGCSPNPDQMRRREFIAGVGATTAWPIAAHAQADRVPTVHPFGLFAAGSGLMSYRVVVVDLYSRAAGYVDRTLKGSVVAEMPVQQPTNYELVIKLRTAKALGLEVPSILLLAPTR
jgi:putative ABC transport system substrate-binding protein